MGSGGKGFKKFMTTLILENNYSPSAIALYKKLGPVYFEKKYLKKADILVVRLAVNVDKKMMDSAPNLKAIATSTTGLNHIDMDYAARKGVKVISLRGHTSFLKNIPSTAEETMALILALSRRLPWAFDYVKNGGWDSAAWSGHQLFGKTIGLLGFGRLGMLVAEYAKAFGMRVVARDPYVSKKKMNSRGVKKVDMSKLFKTPDILSLHVLLTEKTRDLVEMKHLRMMKKNAYLINTARAELIEKGSLYKALKNKWIAGAAVDVLWDERPDGSHLKKDALWKYAKENQNLIILPHIGGAAIEAMHTTQNFVADLVLKYFKK